MTSKYHTEFNRMFEERVFPQFDEMEKRIDDLYTDRFNRSYLLCGSREAAPFNALRATLIEAREDYSRRRMAGDSDEHAFSIAAEPFYTFMQLDPSNQGQVAQHAIGKNVDSYCRLWNWMVMGGSNIRPGYVDNLFFQSVLANAKRN